MLSMKSKAFWIALPLTVTAVSILGVTRLRRQAGQTGQSAPGWSRPQPTEITIPAKTEIEIRLDQSIATNRVASGDPFLATRGRAGSGRRPNRHPGGRARPR